jgi:hypothetical protein
MEIKPPPTYGAAWSRKELQRINKIQIGIFVAVAVIVGLTITAT